MSYLYELPNSTSGIDNIIYQMTTGSFYWLTPIILFFVFMVVFVGGITRQKFRQGTSDYAAWSVLGSIATLLVALFFSVATGYIRLDWLVIVISMNILTAIWFFLDRKITEV